MAEDTTLDAFPPASIVVRAGGEDLQILPFQVGDVPEVLRIARGLDGPLDFAGSDNDALMEMLAEHGDELIQIVTLGARKPRVWVKALQIDDFLVLSGAVYRANMDFFVQRLVPRLATLLNQWIGPKPSADSSAQATAGKT